MSDGIETGEIVAGESGLHRDSGDARTEEMSSTDAGEKGFYFCPSVPCLRA